MKRLLLSIAIVLCAITASAKEEDPEDFKVRVTKADGTVFEGYNETNFKNYFRPKVTTISVSDEYKGTPVKYKSSEIKRLEFVSLMNDSLPLIFDAVKASLAMPNQFNKNPKPNKEPVMLRLIYEGENVTGYAMPCKDITNVPSMTRVVYTWKYFYKTKDSDVAKAYWIDVDDIIPGMKKVMKFYFREFPELVKMVDEKKLTPKEFREHPAMVLPLMDRTYQSNKKK